jgi:hypothetical protein
VSRQYREVLLVTSGARQLRGLEALGDLATMLDLQLNVVG